MPFIITVEECDSDQRIQSFLKKKYPHLPYHHLQQYFRKGEFKINGKKAHKNDFIYVNDSITVPPPHFLRKEKKSLSIDKDIAFKKLHDIIIDETKNFIIVNKPAGLAVQGGVNNQEHIDLWLQSIRPEHNYLLVHRLDKETSGVMMIAKGRENARKLTKDFSLQNIHKQYDVFCENIPSHKNKGKIDFSLKEGMNEKIIVDDRGKHAVTAWRLHKDFGIIKWLKCEPLTGRKHQIRVHLSASHCPIIGDKKYGLSHIISSKKLLLHAGHIKLKDGYHISADLPPYMKALISEHAEKQDRS